MERFSTKTLPQLLIYHSGKELGITLAYVSITPTPGFLHGSGMQNQEDPSSADVDRYLLDFTLFC
jgi:hypothetical protein